MNSTKGSPHGTINKTARMAGFLYFIYMVMHISADVIGRSKLIVYGDAATTARNIMASAGQFQLGFMLDLIAASPYTISFERPITSAEMCITM